MGTQNPVIYINFSRAGGKKHHCGNTRHLWESKTPFRAQKTPIWEHEMPRRGNKKTPVGTRNTCGNKKQQSGKKRRTGREPGTENPEPKGHRRSRNPIPTRTAGTQHYTASHTSWTWTCSCTARPHNQRKHKLQVCMLPHEGFRTRNLTPPRTVTAGCFEPEPAPVPSHPRTT